MSNVGLGSLRKGPSRSSALTVTADRSSNTYELELGQPIVITKSPLPGASPSMPTDLLPRKNVA